jgi:hypothetical protein
MRRCSECGVQHHARRRDWCANCENKRADAVIAAYTAQARAEAHEARCLMCGWDTDPTRETWGATKCPRCAGFLVAAHGRAY